MNKTILKRTFLLIIFTFVMWLFVNHVDAAYVSISLNKTTASPGETITGTISSDCIGRVNLSSSKGTITPDRVWIEGGSQSFSVTVGNSGTTSISASPEGGVMSDGGKDVEVQGASTVVSIATSSNGSSSAGGSSSGSSSSGSSSSGGSTSNNETTSKESSNANLSNLGIRPNDFSGFTPGTTTYNVTVPEDIESVEVYATAQDSSATVSGTGTKTLEYGANALSVTVTAEDGTTKTYTINVTREETEQEEEEQPEEDTEVKNGLSNITIGDLELTPSFATDVYEYTVKYIGEDTSLDIQAVATDPNYTVEILGNEELKEGENIITILVSDEEGNNVATYQLTVNKSLIDEEALAREEEERQQQEQRKMFMIVGGVVVLILIIIIVIIIKRRRSRTYAEEFSGVPFAGINDQDNYDNNDDGNDNQVDNYDNNYLDEQSTALQEENDNRIQTQENNDTLEFDDNTEQSEKERAKREFLNGYNIDNDREDYKEEKVRRGRKKGKRFK